MRHAAIRRWRLLCRWTVVLLALACCRVLAAAPDATAASTVCYRGILILLHGVNSGPETYGRFKERVWQPELADTLLLEFNYGREGSVHGSGAVGQRGNAAIGMSEQAWVGVAKLKDLVAQCRALFGPEMPVAILAHSQGSVIAVAALQEGMQADNVVLMGSCLGYGNVHAGAYNTHLDVAARNVSGTLVNVWSASDQTVQVYKRGIGGFGLPAQIAGYTGANLRSMRVRDVQHTGNDGWWASKWLQQGYRGRWSGGTREELLALLHGGEPYGTAVSPEEAIRLQQFASEAPPAGWYGEADRDRFAYTFTLTPGLQNGIHFDDKDWCRYTVACRQGTVRCRIREARHPDRGTEWRTLHAGESATVEYQTPASVRDAMLWLQVEGLSDEIARADCTFEAEDR